MRNFFTILLLCLMVPVFGTEVQVTFKVDMSEADIEYPNGVFIVGEQTDWAFIEMAHEGDEVYSVTLTLTAGDSVAYYYIVNDTWDEYLDYRETVPEECANSAEVMGYPEWDNDRAFIVPEEDVTFAYFWGSCQTFGDEGGNTSIGRAQNLNFSIFPNPARDVIHVDLLSVSGNGKIEIIDLTGRTVKEIMLNAGMGNLAIDVSDLPSNIYMMKVTEKNELGIQKFIVK